MKMTNRQLELIKAQLKRISQIDNGFYKKRFEGYDININSQEDFEKLPFLWKGDLRDAYPLGLQSVPDEDIIRIHSSSGTTGTPVIIPYTQKDVDDWSEMFRRCYEITGVTKTDRVHITPGYGLWTAGIGFQAGAELLGAMTIPIGPGNTDKQLQMMMDLKSSVLCATSSYALLLAEEIQKRKIKDKIHLKKALIGSERWGDAMRKRIAHEMGVELYDIYGLTEIYGPGVAISCSAENGMHFWDDYLFFEIVDPKTGEVLPDGESGELVVTTLCKEGAPLIRFRTHDLTKFILEECPCGCKFPKIDRLIGRTDDMIKVKGVNIFPSQIDELLKNIPGASSEYQVIIDHLDGKDLLTLFVERQANADIEILEHITRDLFKLKIGIGVDVKIVEIGDLPRSERKTRRVFDNRY